MPKRRSLRPGAILPYIANQPPLLPRTQERVRQAILGLGRAGLLTGSSPYSDAVNPWARRRNQAAVIGSGRRAQSLDSEPLLSSRARSGRRLLSKPSLPNRLSRPVSLSYLMGLLSYSFPRRVQVCVRRQIRRQVMFAHRYAGRSGLGRGRRWRRTEESNYSC